jgi:hypothetical protein
VNILFVTSHCPFAPAYGTQLRMLNIARLLSRLGRVSFVVTDNYERDLDTSMIGWEFHVERIAHVIRLPVRTAIQRIQHDLDPAMLETEGCAVCKKDQRAMAELIEVNDQVWIHGVQTANMFQIFHWPRSVLDIDDIPSRLFASKARASTRFADKINNYRRALIWWRRERILRTRFNVIATASAADRQYLGGGPQFAVVPNGFERPAHSSFRAASHPPRIGFVGTLKWPPNREGIEWFIQLVWPVIKTLEPTVRLRLLGECSDTDFSDLALISTVWVG